MQLINSLNHICGNICPNAWQGQTNWHIIWPIHYFFLKPGSQLTQRPSSDRPTALSRAPKCHHSCSGGLLGVPWSRVLYLSNMCKSIKWGKGAGYKGAETQPTSTHSPQSGAGELALKLRDWREWALVHIRLDLSAAPRRWTGLCIITSWLTLVHPPQDGFRRKSCQLQRNGWLGRGCKQEQCVLLHVPGHLSGASAAQVFSGSTTGKLGWARAGMIRI